MLIWTLAQVTARPLTADEVLAPYIYVFYVAFVVSFLFTPVMRIVALEYGIIDNPDRVRKLHSVPIAYLGGVAVFLGLIAGLAMSQFLRLHTSDTQQPQPITIKFSVVIGACVIVLLGLWDDILSIKPRTKIVGQVFAAGFLLLDGVGTRCMAPLTNFINRVLESRFSTGPGVIPDWFVVAISSLFVVLVVVGCCNASNLIDGLDGLCGGVTAIIAAGFLFVAVNLAMNGGGLNANWDALRVVLALALLGAVLGFVPYNFNPASIFMGDTGSMLLGYVCAVLIILMGQGEHPKWFLASLVMFALPILDTALAFTRRWVNGRPLFSADKFHFHHQLLGRGLSVRQAVLISYGLAIFFAALGASIVMVRTRYSAAFWMVIFGSIIVAAFKMGMIHERPRTVDRKVLGDGGAQAPPDPASADRMEGAGVLEITESSPLPAAPDPRSAPVSPFRT